MVVAPREARVAAVLRPTPSSRVAGRGSRKAASSAGSTRNTPRSPATWLAASRARNFPDPIPTRSGRPSSAATRLTQSSATLSGGSASPPSSA